MMEAQIYFLSKRSANHDNVSSSQGVGNTWDEKTVCDDGIGIEKPVETHQGGNEYRGTVRRVHMVITKFAVDRRDDAGADMAFLVIGLFPDIAAGGFEQAKDFHLWGEGAAP